MKILGILNSNFSRFHQFDPTYDAIINALKCTIPGLIGAFCWIYFRRPFSSWIVVLPLCAYIVSFSGFTYKQKFSKVAVFLIVIAAIQFATAVLFNHLFVLVIVLFILILVSVLNSTYRYSAVFAVFLGVIYISLTPGWYLGVFRTITIIITAVILPLLLIIYEYLFSKLKLRYTIIYFFELISDAFNVSTAADYTESCRKLSHKYLSERPLSFRADVEVEKVFKTVREKYAHRLILQIISKSTCLDKEEYWFKKNKNYRDYVLPVYVLLRRTIRSLTFMLKYNLHKTEINKLYPTTSILIKDIKDALKSILLFFKEDKKIGIFFNEEDINSRSNQYR